MKVFIAGGAGFIGSHFVDHFMNSTDATVTVFDNFTSGQMWHLKAHEGSSRLRVARGDLKEREQIVEASAGHNIVYHFASNPDIAKAMAHPDVDFWEGTYLTQNLLEAIRINKIPALVYASGSGVYGDTGEKSVTEDYSPMLPISPYGASKLSCEAMIHAYCHMFGLTAHVFRFANVVGPRQTHGVGFDFVRRLQNDPSWLRILGDGTQSKSYIHVSDIVAGIQHFAARDREKFNYYHLATGDYITVNEIADLACEIMGISNVRYEYSGGNRGWSGDVPIVRFDLSKTHARGWDAKFGTREALRRSILAMLDEIGFKRQA
ncbi:MAG: NAD-dependent epimerase/dehydratase family protein [Rhizomicrobium sp.]